MSSVYFGLILLKFSIQMSLVVGIVGPKGSGKDTVADYLVLYHSFTKRAYAAPIKELCQKAFLFSDEQLHGNLKEVVDARWGITPRHAFQSIGTDYFRTTYGENHWIQHMRLWIESWMHNGDGDQRLVISDVRFPNEAEFIRTFPKNLLIRVTRDSDAQDAHASEQEHTSIVPDVVIENNGTRDELFQKIEEALTLR